MMRWANSPTWKQPHDLAFFSCFSEPTPPQPRSIHRQQVKQCLAIAAMVALVASSCKGKEPSNNKTTANAPTKTENVEALYYANAQECKTDITQQTKDYQTLKQAYSEGKLVIEPKPPPLKPEECDAQFQAAKQEHERNAPVYASQADCQADGVRCEPTPRNYDTPGYRPIFGGYYLYPFSNRYQTIYYGGVERRVFQPYTVYESSTPNRVVTPNGRAVSRTTTGKVQVPKHVTNPAPARPAGTAARGTISGRSSGRGFGSTFRGTGRGGK